MTFLFNDMEGAAKLSDAALLTLQCHILRSPHCLRSTQVFHRFKNRKVFAQWLGTVRDVSNAKDQREVNGAITTLLFTHAGLSLLGTAPTVLSRMDTAFQRGARHQRTIAKLVDASPVNWEQDHKTSWHAVVLHAHDGGFNTAQISPISADHQILVEAGAAFGADGEELNDPAARRHSHFGIADAGREPVYTLEEYEQLYEQRHNLRPDHVWKWDPRHALSTLLVPDPLTKESGRFGSYFVYRKYRQDVAEFLRRIGEIAQTISDRMTEVRKGGSKRVLPKHRGYTLLAEFEQPDYDALCNLVASGARLQQVLATPLAAALVEFIFGVNPSGGTKAHGRSPDFNYDDDPRGRTCPFNAHARKAAPRGQTRDIALERRVTVARRSSSYKKKDGETGLLFWCAQASIADQFEYIQEKWANALNVNPDHKPTPGFDTAIGQLTPEMRKTYDGWMDSTEVHVSVWEAVKHVASEYLYAPSLDGLKALGALGGAR